MSHLSYEHSEDMSYEHSEDMSYEHSENMSCETAYEAYFKNADNESRKHSREDFGQTSGLWNLPIRQELSLQEQDDLCQQRLKGEKRKDRQNNALAISRARFGTTINEQRNFFHEKSRSFALDPTKSRDPLPAAVGDLSLRQLALLRVQTVSLPVAPVVAPVSVIVPAIVVPLVESGCGAMFDIFAEEEDLFVFREMLAVPAVLTSPKAVVTTRSVVVRIPAYDIFSEEDAIFGNMLTAPVVLGAPTVPYVATAVVSPVVTPPVVHDIFTDDDLFGDMFAVPSAPAMPYMSVSPAVESPSPVVSPSIPATRVVANKSSLLSKRELAVRNLELMNKGSSMGALIQIFQEMEADGRVTYPKPALEPIAAPEAVTSVVPVVSEPVSVSAEVPVTAPVVPDLSSEEEILSESEKDSTTGSPSSQSSLSDEENFLSKIRVTPMPTPTKAKAVKVTPMKALISDTLTTPSPLRLDVPEKSRPESPTPSPSMKKLMGLGKKAFTPSLKAIEVSPIGSPLKEQSPPSSPFVRPGNPTPTKAGRSTRTFTPVLSPIAFSDFEEEEEEPISPIPLSLNSILLAKTTFTEDINSALEESSIPTIHVNGAQVIETEKAISITETPLPNIEDPKFKGQEMGIHPAVFKTAQEEEEENLPEPSVTNTGAMATIASAYLIAKTIQIAPMPITILIGSAAFAAYRFFGKGF